MLFRSHGLWAELHVAVREADAARAYVTDFIETVKRDSFARLPGIRPAIIAP